MTPSDLNVLWDPSADPAGGGGELIRALEARLRPLRAGDELPTLELPERSRERSDRGAGVAGGVESPSAPTGMPGWVIPALALAAAVLLAWVFLPALDDWGPLGPDAIARAPQVTSTGEVAESHGVQEPAPAQAFDGWEVEAFEGQPACNDDRVAEGEKFPNDGRIHSGEATVRLTNGAARVDLHPDSELAHAVDDLQLVQGRLWAELPTRDDGWRLLLGGTQVTATEARFVAWVDDEGIGVEVVSGSVRFEDGDPGVGASAGHTCRASVELGPLVGTGTVHCGPTAATP